MTHEELINRVVHEVINPHDRLYLADNAINIVNAVREAAELALELDAENDYPGAACGGSCCA